MLKKPFLVSLFCCGTAMFLFAATQNQTIPTADVPGEPHHITKLNVTNNPPSDPDGFAVLETEAMSTTGQEGVEVWNIDQTTGDPVFYQQLLESGIYGMTSGKLASFNGYPDIFTLSVDANGQVNIGGWNQEAVGAGFQKYFTVPIGGPGNFAPGLPLVQCFQNDGNVANDPIEIDLVGIYDVDKWFVANDNFGGQFVTVDTFTVTSAELHSVKLAELNGSGRTEVVFLDKANRNVIVFENTTPFTAATFNEVARINIPGTAFEIDGLTLEDYDGDSNIDILVTSADSSEVVAVRNQGALSFANPTTLLSLNFGGSNVVVPRGMDMDDVDGDSDLDLVFTGSVGNDSVMGVAIGDGTGTYTLDLNGGPGYLVWMGTNNAAAQSYVVVAGVSEFTVGNLPVEQAVAFYRIDQDGRPSPALNVLAGPGYGAANPNQATVWVGDNSVTTASASIYSAGSMGLNVAAGDIDGIKRLGGVDENIYGPGPGTVYGPQVRGYRRNFLLQEPIQKVNYFGYGTLKFGINVSTLEVDGDVFEEIITGAGPGSVFGPHARGWNFDGATLTAIQKINFFAYGTPRFGLNTGGGDVDGDSIGEILTGPGPSPAFSAQVRGWNYDGASLSSMGKINFNAFSSVGGCKVAAGDVDNDGFDEIAVVGGIGAPNRYRGFDFDGNAIASLPGFDVEPRLGSNYGGSVGLDDVQGDASDTRADLLTGAGPDSAWPADVKVYSYDGAALTLDLDYVAFPGLTYGTNVTGTDMGF